MMEPFLLFIGSGCLVFVAMYIYGKSENTASKVLSPLLSAGLKRVKAVEETTAGNVTTVIKVKSEVEKLRAEFEELKLSLKTSQTFQDVRIQEVTHTIDELQEHLAKIRESIFSLKENALTDSITKTEARFNKQRKLIVTLLRHHQSEIENLKKRRKTK